MDCLLSAALNTFAVRKKVFSKRQRTQEEKFALIPLDISVQTEFETGFADSDNDLLKEDDPVQDFVIVPKTSTMATHQKIIAMSLASRMSMSTRCSFFSNFHFVLLLSR